MHYLSAQDLLGLVSPSILITAIEQGLRDFSQGKAIAPTRQHVDFGRNTLLSMPVVGEHAFGAKLVSVIPSNVDRGLPIVSGLMVLCDGATGSPLAILDAAALTAQRTGAVGAIGLKYTTSPDIDSVGIIGPGVQGTWQAIFACAVRPIKTVYFVARSDDAAQRFSADVARNVPSVRLTRCRDAEELLTRTSVIIAATTSTEPVLPERAELLENKHFISVGSFKPTMQELPNAVYRLAGHAVIDSDAARKEVGDLINPLSSGVLKPETVFHLAELVVGQRTVECMRTTAFKSVGMALYDLYAAQAFVAEAQRQGRGTQL